MPAAEEAIRRPLFAAGPRAVLPGVTPTLRLFRALTETLGSLVEREVKAALARQAAPAPESPRRPAFRAPASRPTTAGGETARRLRDRLQTLDREQRFRLGQLR